MTVSQDVQAKVVGSSAPHVVSPARRSAGLMISDVDLLDRHRLTLDPGVDLPEPGIAVARAALRDRSRDRDGEERREPGQPLELLPRPAASRPRASTSPTMSTAPHRPPSRPANLKTRTLRTARNSGGGDQLSEDLSSAVDDDVELLGAEQEGQSQPVGRHGAAA